MHMPIVTTRDFIAGLQPYADKCLVFEHGGRLIQPGYHVTEIKAASYRSLDCGARPQRWEETIVQLWDVADESHEGHMKVSKFLNIWRKVDSTVGLSSEAEIKFEWGDDVTPAVHYTLSAIRDEGDVLIVSLEPVRATCKPRDEWWLSRTPANQASRFPSADVCCTAATADMDQTVRIVDGMPIASAGCCANDALGKWVATAADSGPLDAKTRELIKLGMAAAQRSESAVKSHAHRALAEGASAEEVTHAVLLGITTIGFPAMMTALSWVQEALDSHTP